MIDENARMRALLAHAGVATEDRSQPCIFMIDEPDVMLYLEEDIDYTARLVPRSNMWLLYSKTLPERLIGVKIDGFDETPTFKITLRQKQTTEDPMTGEVVQLHGSRKPKLPAVVSPKDKERAEKEAVAWIARYAVNQAEELLRREDPEAFEALPESLRRQKCLYKARELVKQVDPRLEQMTFEELMGNDDPLPPDPPSSTYSA